jgi:hypothetical protein
MCAPASIFVDSAVRRGNTDDKSFTKVCQGMVQLPHQQLQICARGYVPDTHRCT